MSEIDRYAFVTGPYAGKVHAYLLYKSLRRSFIATAFALMWVVPVSAATGPATVNAEPANAVADQAHPLLRAQSLNMDKLGTYDTANLYEAAQWLYNWSKMTDRAPITGDQRMYLAANQKAKKIFEHLHERDPDNAAYFAGLASSMYNIGEMLADEAKDERMARYERMVALMKTCVEKIDPKNAVCWTLLGLAYGRLGTTRGVLSSAFLASDVEDAWQRALELNSSHVSLNGDPISIDATYGLAVFYRIVPDNWLVKVFTGTRGDKEKSVAYLRRIAGLKPYRLELQKELAVSLLCYGSEEDDASAIKEAERILRSLIAGEFDARDNRMTDKIDKAHARELMERPPKDACGYSRDGFQDLSDDALRKAERAHREKL